MRTRLLTTLFALLAGQTAQAAQSTAGCYQLVELFQPLGDADSSHIELTSKPAHRKSFYPADAKQIVAFNDGKLPHVVEGYWHEEGDAVLLRIGGDFVGSIVRLHFTNSGLLKGDQTLYTDVIDENSREPRKIPTALRREPCPTA